MLFAIFTILSLYLNAVFVRGACTKFSSISDLQKTVMVDGRCVYGFSQVKLFSDANNLCSSEGTRMIVLETVAKQEETWNALGSEFGQHWMGLKKQDGVWKWKTEDGMIPMTSPRWETESGGKRAYTMSSDNRFLWKMASTLDWYRPVCEEITGSTTTDAVPTVTIPPQPVISGDVMFTRINTLNSVMTIDSISVVNIKYCVLRCLRRPDCTDIVYKPSTPNCILTKQDQGAGGFDCISQNKCFHKNI